MQSSSICVKSSSSSQLAAREPGHEYRRSHEAASTTCARHLLNAVGAADTLSLPSFSAVSHASVQRIGSCSALRNALCVGIPVHKKGLCSLSGSMSKGRCMDGWYTSWPRLLASDAALSVAQLLTAVCSSCQEPCHSLRHSSATKTMVYRMPINTGLYS